MALQLNTSRSLISKKLVGVFFAIFALFIQPLVALDVPSAFAAPTTIYSYVGEQVRPASPFSSTTLDLTRYGNLALSFTYDKEKLDSGESFSYGWRDSSAVEHVIATVPGAFNDDPASVLVEDSLPVEASASGVSIFLRITANQPSDLVELSDVSLAGEATDASLSTDMPTEVTVKQEYDFETSIDEIVNTNELVRVKITANPAQTDDVVLKYYETAGPNAGTYQPLTFTGGVAYFGPSTGFPLMDATTPMKATFKGEGTYTSTTEIVRVADGTRIGEELTNTVEASYLPVPTASAQSTQTVRPADFAGSGWVFYNDTNDTYTTTPSSTSTFATDPGDSTKGALKFSDPTNKMDVASFGYAGTPLRDISAIGYDSYNTSSSGGRTYMQFNVDFNGTDTWQKRLTFVPATSNGAWQSNEGVQDGEGMWQWSGGNTWPDGVVAPTRSWNDIVASFPDARIRVTDTNAPGGGVFVRSEPGSTNYIDNVYVATASSNVKYDFEMPDVTGPELDVTTPAVDGIVRAPGVYTLEGTVSDSGVGFDRMKVQIKDMTDNLQVLSPTSVTSYSGDNWSFDVSAGTFENGHEYKITLNAYDNVNNLTTVRRTITIDNAKPALFEITTPATGDVVGEDFTVSGTAYDDISGIDSVRYKVRKITGIGGTTSGSAVIPWTDATYDSSTDTWSFDISDFEDGYYRIAVQGVDAVGNYKARSIDVKVDAEAPVATDEYSNNGLPTNQDVKVTLTINEAIDTPTGWTYITDTKFEKTFGANGPETVTLVDKYGNEGTKTITVTGIDKVAPAEPVINSGSATHTGITGSAEANSTLIVYVNGLQVGSTAVDALGNWAYTFNPALDSTQSFTLTVKAEDGAGNVSNPSAPYALTATSFVRDDNFENTTTPISPLSAQTAFTSTAIVAGSTNDDTDDKEEVLGTKTEDSDSPADKVAAIAPSEDGWKLWGIAWYWYLLALGAVGAGTWYGVRRYRGPEEF